MKQRFEQLLNFTHQDIQSSLFKSLFDLTEIGQLLLEEKNDHFLFYFMKCYTDSPRIIKFMLKEFIPEGLGKIAFKQLRIITACLHEENLFNLENFDLMLSCPYPEQMMSQYHAINLFNIFGILDADNRNFLKFKPNPEEHAQILIELHQHELLTNEIKNILKNQASPLQLSQNLIILQQAGLNTAQNRQLIFNHPNQQTIKNAFLALQNAHILDQNH
jgi:hypothetical protein